MNSLAKVMVTPGGIEPPTHCLEGSCSNPLSYGAMVAVFTCTKRHAMAISLE